MSLLIKALEQAAKDRDNAKGVSSTSPASAASAEPTLEPAPLPRNSGSSRQPSTSSATGASALRESSSQPGDARGADRASSEADAFAHIDAQQQRARAAAVMEASRSSGSMLLSYLRGNPVMMFGTAAAVFGIGFGIYVYLQVAKPGLFVQQAAHKPPENAQPPSMAQVSAPPLASPSSTSAAMDSPATAAVSELTPSPASSNAAAAPASAGVPASTGHVAGVREPIPASAVIASASSRDVAPDAASAPTAATGAAPKGERVRETTRGQASASAAAPANTRREQIAVSPSVTQPKIEPALAQAYSALQAGKLDEARTTYAKLSQSEPLNVDALLGLAYIAAQDNRSDDAMRLYLRILQINPRHAAAQGALIGLMGRADPVASETRLKQLIAREPSPFLHFVLGNLYADQGMWAQAQLAYYQAHHLESDNPDYAYNLAVGLDHLGQNKLAVGFYRRAEQLATALGRANFDVSHARERIGILSSQLE